MSTSGKDFYNIENEPQNLLNPIPELKDDSLITKDILKHVQHMAIKNMRNVADEKMEINPLLLIVLRIFSKHRDKVFNFIDVGCAFGDCLFRLEYLKYLKNYNFNIHSIGIDPLITNYKEVPSRYNGDELKSINEVYKRGLQLFTNLIECAISTEEGEHDFYVQEALDCSSLNKINTSKITHEETSDDNFFLPTRGKVAKKIITTKEIKKVPVKKLSSVIEEHNLNDEIIHFLKVDAQGQDLNVIKSCEKYLKNVALIMLETTMPYITNGTLYENSTNFKQDMMFFKKNNFKLIKMKKLLHDDADVLLYNKSLLTPEGGKWQWLY